MGWYFDDSSHVTLQSDPAISIPDGSWTFMGWVRLQDNSGTQQSYMLSLGTAGATPSVYIRAFQSEAGGVQEDHLIGTYVDNTGKNRGIHNPNMALSSHLDKWIPWAFTHDASLANTYMLIGDTATGQVFTNGISGSMGPAADTDFSGPIYLGARSDLDANRFFDGDLAEFSFIPGTSFSTTTFRRFMKAGRRGYKYPGCTWHVPMIGGRYEEWINQLTVSNNGSVNSGTHPPVRLITPPPSTPTLDIVDPLAVTAASPISLGQDASVEHVPSYVGTDTLSLSQVASYELIQAYHGESTLTLGSVGDQFRVCFAEASSTLELGDVTTYVGPKFASAVQQLILTQSAYVPSISELLAISVISLDQDVVRNGTNRVNAESTLELDQIADTIIKLRSAASQIDLVQEATVDFVLTASSQIDLTQDATAAEITRDGFSSLVLDQTARFEPFAQFAESQIELTQLVRQSIRNIQVESQLELTHSVLVEKPIRVSATSDLTYTEWVTDVETGEINLEEAGLRHEATLLATGTQSVEHLLSFRQDVSFTHVRVGSDSVSATSTLTLTQEARSNEVADAESTINLTHAAEGWAGRPGNSSLDLTQVASVVHTQSLDADNELGVTQAAAYTLIVGSTICDYSPFVGTSSDPNAPTPPSETIDGLMSVIEAPFQLVYPADGSAVTDSVTLKTPNLGNLDRLAFNRVLRETRGGTLIVFADPIWPKLQTLVLSFSGLKQTEAMAVLTFIEAHLGLEIGLIDWEHRFWKGVIINPDTPIIEDGRDSFTVSLEFQGELDPDWTPQVIP